MTTVAPDQAGLDPRLPERLRAVAQAQIDEGLARGMQLFVARRGKVVVDEALGLRADDDRPMTTQTRLPVMSDSKPVTATALHLVAERGDLTYADPIVRFLPEFGANLKSVITFHQALTHRAGIADFYMRWVPPEVFADWDQAITDICALPLETYPGTQAMYHALTVWAIFAEVVRRVDGRAFHTFCDEEIFRPLGMTRTTWGLPDELLDEACEMGTALEDDAWTPRWREARRWVIPGGGLWSTASDLGRFYMAWGAGGTLGEVRLLSPATVRLATSKLGEPWQPELRVWAGYGFSVGNEIGRYSRRGSLGSDRTFGHGGGTVSTTWCDPDTDLVFVATANLAIAQEANDRRFHVLSDVVHRAVLPD